jgi:RNA polymerase sigma-70 factor (ECF subfamily)
MNANETKTKTTGREEFDELTRTYYPRMKRIALRTLRNEEDAEDATQQAFLAAWVNLDKFRGDSSFGTWITRITMNEAYTILRKNKRQFVELDGDSSDSSEETKPVVADNAGTPEEALIRKETDNLVHLSMEQVRPAYRMTMRLRIVEDMSLDEIANRLRMPVGTVKVHLFRGREAMKGFLEQKMTTRAAA